MPEDTTSSWMDWLKRPENLMTGVVLAAALAQPRRAGQNVLGKIGESAVGGLAFRGGLESGVKQAQDKERETQQMFNVQNTQLAQGNERNQIAREDIRSRENVSAADNASRLQIANTARPNTPAEAALLRSQSGYYDRMPAGINDPNSKLQDPYEEEIFKSWYKSESDRALAEGKPYSLNPMAWLQHVQPYRNARTQVDAMRKQGLMGEIIEDNGQYKVRVVGVADPKPAAAPEAPGPVTPNVAPPNDPVVTISPAQQLAGMRPEPGNRQKSQERMINTGRARGSRDISARQNYIESLDEPTLRSLLKDKNLDKKEIGWIKETLKRNASATTR